LPEKETMLIQRYGHSAATLTINSDCVELILFCGLDKNHSPIADTTILRFGKQRLLYADIFILFLGCCIKHNMAIELVVFPHGLDFISQ